MLRTIITSTQIGDDDSEIELTLESAMATAFSRLARRITTLTLTIRSSRPSMFPSTAMEFSGDTGCGRPRWASSSSKANPEDRRLSTVIDAVNDRKLPPELRGQRNAVRSETDIINVVEKRIWHSMEEGQFENLPGKGKPLNNLSTNPHADPADDTLYRILSKSGFAPEWVELNKEIRDKISNWRSTLKKGWEIKCSGDQSKWVQSSEALKIQLKDINDKIFRYNLIVPFGRQMSGLRWDKELTRVEE